MVRKRTLSLELEFRSGLPAYAQIVRRVERMVASRALQPGDQLPTVRALAEELGLNFNTVARAYRALGEAAAVSTQRGRGTYIVQSSAARPARQRTVQALAADYVREAKRHRLTDAAIVALVANRLRSWKEPG
jgi:GntR family transcriptional regulator